MHICLLWQELLYIGQRVRHGPLAPPPIILEESWLFPALQVKQNLLSVATCLFPLSIRAKCPTQVIILDLTTRFTFVDEYPSSSCQLCNSTKTRLLFLSKCVEWFELFSLKYMCCHCLYTKISAWVPKRSKLLDESFRVKIQYQHSHVFDCQLLHYCESFKVRSWL